MESLRRGEEMESFAAPHSASEVQSFSNCGVGKSGVFVLMESEVLSSPDSNPNPHVTISLISLRYSPKVGKSRVPALPSQCLWGSGAGGKVGPGERQG